jgi:UDP-glucose 4-epimerase
MKILVTGGAGFIGSQVAEAYIERGHDVTALDDLSIGRKRNIPSRAQFVPLDIRDPELRVLFAKSKFDMVNHHAAQIDVRRSVRDPSFDASVNISGTLNLLQCSRLYGVKKFIFASSGGAIYGECEKRPALESDLPRPESPYGISKAAAENYIRFYGTCYHLPYTILRYSNVYGPRQDPKGEAGVISVLIQKLLTKEPFTIYGSGQQERDYVYVDDVVAANCAALKNRGNGTFNISTQLATSVNILNRSLSALHPSAQSPVYAPARAGEIERSVLNPSLAQKHLHWHSVFSLEEGLRKTHTFFENRMLEVM